MVLAAPRSGTAWCANWLTTEASVCLHDPLWRYHYDELDYFPKGGRMLGIACTGAALFPEWVNAHRARKVILHRPLQEIDASLEALGFPPVGTQWIGRLDEVKGWHMSWDAVRENPKGVYEYLMQRPFDAERHAILRGLYVERDLDQIRVDPHAASRLARELRAAAQESA